MSPETGLRWLLDWLFRAGGRWPRIAAFRLVLESNNDLDRRAGWRGSVGRRPLACKRGGTLSTSIHRVTAPAHPCKSEARCDTCVLYAIAGPDKRCQQAPITHGHKLRFRPFR